MVRSYIIIHILVYIFHRNTGSTTTDCTIFYILHSTYTLRAERSSVLYQFRSFKIGKFWKFGKSYKWSSSSSPSSQQDVSDTNDIFPIIQNGIISGPIHLPWTIWKRILESIDLVYTFSKRITARWSRPAREDTVATKEDTTNKK